MVRLDTIISASLERMVRWTPALKLSDKLLRTYRYIVTRIYFDSLGQPHKGGVRVSQSTIAAKIGSTREHVNRCIGKLVKYGWLTKWITKVSPITFDIGVYGIGGQTKRLIMSIGPKGGNYSKPQSNHRVTRPSQVFPPQRVEIKISLVNLVKEEIRKRRKL